MISAISPVSYLDARSRYQLERLENWTPTTISFDAQDTLPRLRSDLTDAAEELMRRVALGAVTRPELAHGDIDRVRRAVAATG